MTQKYKTPKETEEWKRKISRGVRDSLLYYKRLPAFELDLNVNKSKFDKYCIASIWNTKYEEPRCRAFMRYNFDSETFASKNPEFVLDYQDYFLSPLEGNDKQWMVEFLFAEANRRIDGELPLTDFKPFRPLTDRDLADMGIRSGNVSDITAAFFTLKPEAFSRGEAY